MTRTLVELKEDLQEEIRDYPDLLDEAYPEDIVTEFADSQVPIYHADLLQLASDNWELLTTEPELGPASGSAFTGEDTAINIIAANVYEVMSAAAHETLQEMRNEV